MTRGVALAGLCGRAGRGRAGLRFAFGSYTLRPAPPRPSLHGFRGVDRLGQEGSSGRRVP
jgi:hypothetical protein